uniref:HTTM-like domain-containing protein n=1 Tax=Paramoeba aestuarina TaxID=180227 RepID=A0A7S4JHQ9_9EUKA|mmetsp:Transcript_10539/g.15855  ORF Transcript_10539/g.15855 Transcript_10539/m.15855 type:complete len:542 (+) Transcript_10539:156-1781(+)|eukprot:CAMPEP_0201523118 /NCGR_PEP_ID=MMETSP0161_2-20130828/18750_1 /ASSEMBLY_ACC=CAM_ASM_000251 /TAXON_ID=180227 /ORGANISM="Neoparamoeba aestuarina, Strain SoJaBio B1-5/56/2" /LENGTH=541 /DNA_ID=CAMNT_0047922121 /DNA_START=178 /DNA_END=1803 /DNA_ORIENTATION=-
MVRQRKQASNGNTSASTPSKEDLKECLHQQQEDKPSDTWGEWLYDPIDAKPFAVLRILWGLVLVMECWSFMRGNFTKADSSFFGLKVNLPYYGFQWLPKLTLPQAHALIVFCFVSAWGVTLGIFYKFSMTCFVLGFSYVYFYEGSVYLNHLYLLLVICSTFAILPCNTRYSVDSYVFKGVYSKTVPRWTAVILYVLLTCVYGHAAQAKCNRDWLRAEPLRHWLPKRVMFYGPLLGQESFAYFLSYGGLIYDAIAAPLLIYKPTRLLGIGLNVFFHVTNKLIFSIGIFPYMMLSFLVLFVDLSFLDTIIPPPLEDGEEEVEVGRKGRGKMVIRRKDKGRKHKASSLKKMMIITLIITYGAFHALFPLRHHFYPGYVAWNEYGHLYSWRMKLRDKNCEIRDVIATDPRTGNNFTAKKVFNAQFSKRQISALRSRPDFLSTGAHATSKALQEMNKIDLHVPVYLDVWCQLNFGPLTQFTNPEFDMASHETFDWPYPWLQPEPEFPDELYKDYPWNFEWTFSWITTFPSCHLRDNNPLYDKGFRS